MKTGSPTNVSDYISRFPPKVRAVLRSVRTTIRKAIPDAEEVISYGIPAFKQHKRVVIYFAGWKEHYSLYPTTARLTAAFKKELAPYDMSGKGTVRFSLSERIPVRLIASLAKFRAQEVAEKATAVKAGRAKKR